MSSVLDLELGEIASRYESFTKEQQEEINRNLQYLASVNDLPECDSLEDLLNEQDWHNLRQEDRFSALKRYVISNNKKLIDRFLEDDGRYTLQALRLAIEYNMLDLAKDLSFFPNQGNSLIYFAGKSRSMDTVNFVLKMKVTSYAKGLEGAVEVGWKEGISFFENKGCTSWFGGLSGAARSNDLELFKYFELKTDNSKYYHFFLSTAIYSWSTSIVDYLLDRKDVDLDKAISKARFIGNCSLYVTLYMRGGREKSSKIIHEVTDYTLIEERDSPIGLKQKIPIEYKINYDGRKEINIFLQSV